MAANHVISRWLIRVGRPNDRLTPVLFAALQVVSTASFVWALFQGYAWYWWLMALGFYALYYGVGLTVAYHRFYTHQSFRASLPVRWFMALTATLGGHSSGLHWVPIHIAHHRHSDGPGDPHSPRDHGWKMLWIWYYPRPAFSKWRMKRYIRKYPELVFTHNYQHWLLAAYWLAVASLGFEAFLFVVLVPYCWTVFAALWLTTGAHKFGYQDYDTRDDSTNNPWMALPTFGEAWHNNHHKRAGGANFGHRWWQVDLGYWIVKLLRKSA